MPGFSTAPEVLDTVKDSVARSFLPGLLVEEVRYTPGRRTILAPNHHLVTMHLGSSLHLCQQRDGQVSRERHTHGDITLTPAGQIDQRAWDSPCHAIHFWVEQDYLAQVAPEINAPSATLQNQFLVRDTFLENLAGEFQNLLVHAQKCSDTTTGGSLYAESLRNVLAAHLLRHFGTNQQTNVPTIINGLPPASLERLRHFVTGHLDENLTLPRLAEAMNISQFHLARLFKSSSGMTLHQFVVEARIAQAKELLATGKASAAEVAYRVGFGSQSLLNRHFKRLVGTTPAAFARARKRHGYVARID